MEGSPKVHEFNGIFKKIFKQLEELPKNGLNDVTKQILTILLAQLKALHYNSMGLNMQQSKNKQAIIVLKERVAELEKSKDN